MSLGNWIGKYLQTYQHFHFLGFLKFGWGTKVYVPTRTMCNRSMMIANFSGLSLWWASLTFIGQWLDWPSWGWPIFDRIQQNMRNLEFWSRSISVDCFCWFFFIKWQAWYCTLLQLGKDRHLSCSRWLLRTRSILELSLIRFWPRSLLSL